MRCGIEQGRWGGEARVEGEGGRGGGEGRGGEEGGSPDLCLSPASHSRSVSGRTQESEGRSAGSRGGSPGGSSMTV